MLSSVVRSSSSMTSLCRPRMTIPSISTLAVINPIQLRSSISSSPSPSFLLFPSTIGVRCIGGSNRFANNEWSPWMAQSAPPWNIRLPCGVTGFQRAWKWHPWPVMNTTSTTSLRTPNMSNTNNRDHPHVFTPSTKDFTPIDKLVSAPFKRNQTF